MYRDFIQRKFAHNESQGLFVAPNLPGSKLGRILAKETRISQPGDVVALYLDSGFFGSTYFILTDDKAYFPDGQVPLENIRSADSDGKYLSIYTGTNTGTTKTSIKLGEEEVAKSIAKILDDLAFHDPVKVADMVGKGSDQYSKFEGKALDWILLRDEVMKTIDLLHEKFQDGKLSLLEYENKKSELLGRL